MLEKPPNPLRVLFITAEAEPFIKIGGLGDYSGSLPKAISSGTSDQAGSVDIRVVLPFLAGIEKKVPPFSNTTPISVETDSGFAKGIVYQFKYQNIIYYLIKRLGNPSGYNAVYNLKQRDDARKYVFFSLASIELIKIIHWTPDIIHANDWHSALSVYQLAEKRKTDKLLASTRSVLAIHNLPFLGEGSQPVLSKYNLKKIVSNQLPVWARSLPLPMGLIKADEIVAVSPTYAEELKTREFGDGLAKFFLANADKLTGILNGIDTTVWDPEKDKNISRNYSIDTLENRSANKINLLKHAGIKYPAEKPLLVMISRLTPQKGIDVLLKGLSLLKNEEWSAVILGSGDSVYEKRLLQLQSAMPARFKVFLGFDSLLAHRLYAAGDFLLMPSNYEPCGLSQMIAMRYGCIPVARSVGGLKDSITNKPEEMKTGYLFNEAKGADLAECLSKAFNDFRNKSRWQAMQIRAMNEDFSWKKSAAQYLALYQSMLEKKPEKSNHPEV